MLRLKAGRVSLAGRKNAWVAGREPCRATWGAGRNEADRAPKISPIKTTTHMSKKTPQSTAAGKANVARTTTNSTIEDTPVFHVGLDVHAADFTAAIAEPPRSVAPPPAHDPRTKRPSPSASQAKTSIRPQNPHPTAKHPTQTDHAEEKASAPKAEKASPGPDGQKQFTGPWQP